MESLLTYVLHMDSPLSIAAFGRNQMKIATEHTEVTERILKHNSRGLCGKIYC